MKSLKLAFGIATLSLGAGSAWAMPQAPHDAAHGVTCASCHIPFGGLTDVGHQGDGAATAATTTSITDASRAWLPNQWVGATILFTSGANSGEFRIVSVATPTSVSWGMPLDAAPAVGDTFELHKTSYEDVEVKCKSCHNPAGIAAAAPSGGMHHTGSQGAIGCGTCHDPHNLLDEAGQPTTSGYVEGAASGGLIRKVIQIPGGRTANVDYADGVFTQPDGSGICQACHTNTRHWSNDGAGQDHSPGTDCTGCHTHELGFGGGATGSGHMDPDAAAFGDHGSGGNHGWSQACQRCHTSGGFQDYVGADGTDNHDDATFNSTQGNWAYGFGPLECQTCHNVASDPLLGQLTDVRFVSLKTVQAEPGTALCSTCHQGRESTPSVNSLVTRTVASASRGLAIVTASANQPGTTTTATSSSATWAADVYRGYTLTFTTGPNQGLVTTVTGNTATTLTFDPALPNATASGHAFTLWPTATGGNGDSYVAGPRYGGKVRGIDLVDTGRAWTDNQWTDFYVYVQTGVNAGLYRKIIGNTADTLSVANPTLTTGMPFPEIMDAGARYQILVKEDTTVLDAVVSSGLSFPNAHYFPAAAILWGSEAMVGYQNPSNWANGTQRVAGQNSYSGRNLHGGEGECTDCHNPHTLEITVNSSTCGRCHMNEAGAPVNSMMELEEVRQFGFEGDIDGDLNAHESLKAEVDGLGNLLFATIRAYGLQTARPICYDSHTHPYFFKDNGLGGGTAGNGTCEGTEASSANGYGAGSGWFTPRLVRATFNYQIFAKEPGAWAHNPRYIIQLLFDAVKDLNLYLTAPNQTGYLCYNATLDPASFPQDPDGTCATRPGYTRTFTPRRAFQGHFDGMATPLRRDETSATSAGMGRYPCKQCHTGAAGFREYLAQPDYNDLTAPYAASTVNTQGFECSLCHEQNGGDMRQLVDVAGSAVGGVRFPGYWPGGSVGAPVGVTLGAAAFAQPADMICTTCHNGRDYNGATVDEYLGGTFSTLNVVGRPFAGAANIVDNLGTIRITGLPLFIAAVPPYAAPNNWLFNGTTCAAVNKYITIEDSVNYNGTYQVTACGDGYADVNRAYVADEAVSWSVFAAATKNNHDIQSAARVFGSDGAIGYEYAGNVYAGAGRHNGQQASCMDCHSPVQSRHTMEVGHTFEAGGCSGNGCHTNAATGGVANLALAVPYLGFQDESRGLTTGDGYDGDPTTVTLSDELGAFADNLGRTVAGYFMARGIKQSGRDPCWNALTNALRQANLGNVTGICDGTEITSWATTNAMDPALVRAWYNLSFTTGDPGAWAHNFDYLAQLLYDSAFDLGGDPAVAGLTRP